MTKYLSIFFAFVMFVSTPLYGQKVKYKKGQVSVDKKHMYNMDEEQSTDSRSKMKSYFLRDLGGNTLLSMKDTTFYLEKLPHEEVPRKGFEAYRIDAKGLSSLIFFNPIMNYGKQRVKDLSKVGFFKKGAFDESIFNAFVEKQFPENLKKNMEEYASKNDTRAKNNQMVVEAFGSLVERAPGEVLVRKGKGDDFEIKESGEVLATIVEGEKGTISHPYFIHNLNGDRVAIINIRPTTNDAKNASFTVHSTAVEGSLETLSQSGNTVGNDQMKLIKKFKSAVEYLIDQAML